MVQENDNHELTYLENDDSPIKFDLSTGHQKVFIANVLDEDPTKLFPFSKLHKLIERFRHVVNIEVVFPTASPSNTEIIFLLFNFLICVSS